MNPTTTTTPQSTTGSRIRGPTESPISAAIDEKTQPAIHALPPLPYDVGALAPALSADTLATHHGQHQRIYVDNVNALSRGTEFARMTLDAIIAATVHSPERIALYRNASQAWNHAVGTRAAMCGIPGGTARMSGHVAEFLT